MAITANLVKELRQRTGAGMMDCKKALVETNGDMEKAVDLMRASGAAKAAKKAGRIASEGLVSIAISTDKKTAAIIEVNSETDFVAKSDGFINFVETLNSLVLKNQPTNLESFLEQKLDSGDTINEAREKIIAKIGENISIRRLQNITTKNGVIGAYKHGDRIAVVNVISGGNEALAKDIAMHIAASNPECIDEKDLSSKIIEREKAIFIQQAKESGKPDNIIEKMVSGKVQKFIKEVTLYNQTFVKDCDITIAKLLKNNNSNVEMFVRFEVGEGIEKKQDNFVKEVMAQAKT